MHYGVLGMKWGVRRNPSKAYDKATVKKEKLISNVNKTRQAYNQAKIKVNSGASAKYQKYQAKATALKVKSDKAEAKKLKRSNPLIRTEISDARYQNAARKADKAKAKYMKVQTKADKYKAKPEKSTLKLGLAEVKHLRAVKKAEKWVKQMNKTFKDVDVKSLDSDKVDSGKSFLEKMKSR